MTFKEFKDAGYHIIRTVNIEEDQYLNLDDAYSIQEIDNVDYDITDQFEQAISHYSVEDKNGNPVIFDQSLESIEELKEFIKKL